VDIATFQAYGYFILVTLMVVLLYSYIYHIYSSQKKGIRDYEKYSNLALNDEVTDEPIEVIDKDDEIKK
jgi:cytochrome c oxidase cbb3-type subunit 4